jgi:hypothetical protein
MKTQSRKIFKLPLRVKNKSRKQKLVKRLNPKIKTQIKIPDKKINYRNKAINNRHGNRITGVNCIAILAMLGAHDLFETDAFGIPYMFCLSLETREEKLLASKQAKLYGKKYLPIIFFHLSGWLGYRNAKNIFFKAAKMNVGRPQGQTNPVQDERFLKIYDELIIDGVKPKNALTEAAKIHKSRFPGPTAVESRRRRLARLLKGREQSQRDQLEINKRIRHRFGGGAYGPTPSIPPHAVEKWLSIPRKSGQKMD